MSDTDTLIDIENDDLSAVERAVSHYLGPAFFASNVPHVAGLHLLIQDLSAEAAYAKEFLATQGVPEEDPFLRSFDMSAFNIEVRLFSERALFGEHLQVVLADLLARALSKDLDSRVLVRFENGSVPFRLYERGIIGADYRTYYEAYLTHLAWQPA